MTTLAEKLHNWSLQELNLVSEGGLSRVPSVESFQLLTKGRNKKIWNYVINHVRSQAAVSKVKRTLFFKKKLEEQQENAVCVADNSMNIEKLQVSLSKATEKREYLKRSLLTIEERILNLNQNVQKTKDEIFQINQKTALLEHLKQIFDEKNLTLKKIFSHILSYQCTLNAYQNSKILGKILMDLSCDFLFENKVVYDENLSRVKDLVIITSGVFRKLYDQDDDSINTLTENFQNNFTELKNHGLLLTEFVMLLKDISRSDLQQFTAFNSQNLSVKEFILEKSKENGVNNHFIQLKCDYIYNSLSAKKSKDEVVKYTTLKSEAFRNAIEKLEIGPNDLDCEIKVTLLEKKVENDALILSNNYFESCLENIASKTETVLKNTRQINLHNNDVNSTAQLFFKDADLTFNLLYTNSSVIQKAISYLNDLKLFACEEIFKLPFPEEKSIENLKDCFSSERKQTWNYSTKTKLIEPIYTECSADNQLSIEICRSINIQPYQSLSILCENWVHFKQKLHAEIAANSKTCAIQNNISVSEFYLKILKVLEKINFSIEKGMLFLTYGTTCCHKNKSLVNEWWNQNAQYIPHIEYKGKTLKMWIDILSVLSDFELQSYV